MALAFLARLLFGLALLAQAAASAHALAPAAGDSRVCVVTHNDARAQSFVGDASEHGPQRETGHRHGPCSFCLFGSGDSPLYSRILFPPTIPIADSARLSFGYCEGMVFFHTDRNAAARAPPAFS